MAPSFGKLLKNGPLSKGIVIFESLVTSQHILEAAKKRTFTKTVRKTFNNKRNKSVNPWLTSYFGIVLTALRKLNQVQFFKKRV